MKFPLNKLDLYTAKPTVSEELETKFNEAAPYSNVETKSE